MSGLSTSAGETAAIRSMTSQVNWALLGLLIERPDYRYRLEQRFERAYTDVLSLGGPSHIYTALKELTRRGLIEKVPGRRAATPPDGEGRQTGPRYRATRQGVRAYGEWMLTQTQELRRHSRLFARQLALLADKPDLALTILEHCQRACLNETTRAPAAAGEGPFGSSRSLADRLVAEDVRLAPQSVLAWINYARMEFRALQGNGRDERA